MLGFNKSPSRLWNLKIKCDSKEIAIHCKVYSELSIAGNCKSAQGFLGIAIQIPVCEAHIAADQCLKTIANQKCPYPPFTLQCLHYEVGLRRTRWLCCSNYMYVSSN